MHSVLIVITISFCILYKKNSIINYIETSILIVMLTYGYSEFRCIANNERFFDGHIKIFFSSEENKFMPIFLYIYSFWAHVILGP